MAGKLGFWSYRIARTFYSLWEKSEEKSIDFKREIPEGLETDLKEHTGQEEFPLAPGARKKFSALVDFLEHKYASTQTAF